MTKNAKPRIAKRAAARVLCGLGVACALMGSVPVEALALTNASTSFVTISDLGKASVTFSKLINVNWDATNDAPKDPMYTWSGASLQSWVRANYPAYIDAAGNVTDTFKGGVGEFGVQDGAYTNNTSYTEFDGFYSKLARAIADGKVTGLTQQTVSGTGSVTQQLQMGFWVANVTDDTGVWRPVTVNMTPVLKNGAWSMPTAYDLTAKGSQIGAPRFTETRQSATGAEEIANVLEFSLPQLPADALDGSVKAKVSGYDASFEYTAHHVVGIKDGKETSLDWFYDYTNAHDDFHGNDTGVSIVLPTSVVNRYDSVRLCSYGRYTEQSDAKMPGGAKITGTIAMATDPFKANTGSNSVERTTETVTHTYGIDLQMTVDPSKYSSDGSVAAFELLDSDGNVIDTLVKTGDGRYAVAGGEPSERYAMGPRVSRLACATSGDLSRLRISGLDNGEYTLRQVEALNGYLLLNDISVTVSDPECDGTVLNPSDNTGYVLVKATPKAGFTLPGTGGNLDRSIAAGLGLLGGSVAVMAVRNKAKGKRDSQQA